MLSMGAMKREISFEMKVVHVSKNDPTGRQVMEGVEIRELEADNILNSRDEFHQPGEWIPVLEGARRNNRKQYGNNNSQGDKDNNSQDDNSNNNSNNSQNDNSINSQNDNSQGVRTRRQRKKVTTAAVEVTTGGVTTRARERRDNFVV